MTEPRQQRRKPVPVNTAGYAAALAAASQAAIALFRRTLPAFSTTAPTAQQWRRFVQAEFLLISHGRRAARTASVGHYQYVIDTTAAVLADPRLAAHVPPGVPDVGWNPPGPSVGPLLYDSNATEAMLDRVVRLHLDASTPADLDTMGSAAIDRHVRLASSHTVLQLVHADQRSIGWVRILGNRARHCAFCITMASRGPVYKSRQSADFQAHDNCACTAVEVFDRDWWPGREASTDYAWGIYNDGAGYRTPDGVGTRNPSIENLRRYLDANPHVGVPVTQRPASAAG